MAEQLFYRNTVGRCMRISIAKCIVAAFLPMLVHLSILSSAGAQPGTQDPGRALLTKHCAQCHGISAGENSRHRAAPGFAEIMKRYRAEMLAEALAEGLTTGHPDMPQFSFEPDEVAAIVRYLDTLSR